MLQIKDAYGDETAIIASDVSITESLGDFSTLSFNFIDNESNQMGAKMMLPMTKVTVPETKQTYRLLTSNPVPIGKYRQYLVTAIHIGHDLHRKYVYESLSNTQSLNACLNLITKETSFNYVIHDVFPNYSFSEDFGKGFADDLLKQNLANDFGFEFYFDNYTIHIYKKIGSDNSFVFIDGNNCAKISVNEDYDGLVTRIKGEGKHDDNDKPIVSAEYTSPLANDARWGIIDAEPVQYDNITDQNTLMTKLKNSIKDYPDIQYTMDYVNFKKNMPGFNSQQIKVGNGGWLRDRFGIDVNTRIFSMTYYPQTTQLPDQITFGNKRFDPIKYSVDLKKAHDENAKLGSKISGEVTKVKESIQSISNYTWTEADVDEWYGH